MALPVSRFSECLLSPATRSCLRCSTSPKTLPTGMTPTEVTIVSQMRRANAGSFAWSSSIVLAFAVSDREPPTHGNCEIKPNIFATHKRKIARKEQRGNNWFGQKINARSLCYGVHVRAPNPLRSPLPLQETAFDVSNCG